MSDETLELALRYAAMGWHVFPCHSVKADGSCTCGDDKCTDSGKHPRTKQGLKDASCDKAQIEKWFGPKAPLSNIGIVTGEISNLTVLDIDIGTGKFGAESWATIIQEHGEPETLRCTTGGGGIHLFFLYNSALKTASNVLGRNIDCRNDRGYVVAAPSRHRSGGVYEWMNWGVPLLPLPVHLSVRKENRGRPRKDDVCLGKYGLEQVRAMLECVPAGDRDLWRYVGIILGRTFNRSDEAWACYVNWAAKWDGAKGRGHDETMHDCFHNISQETAERELSMGTIVKAAIEHGWVPKTGDVSVDRFVYDHASNQFLYRPSGALWLAASVDAGCSPVNVDGKLVKASVWIQRNARITTTTCTPAIHGDILKDFDCREGALIESHGGAVFNRYRPPTIDLGDASLAGPFVEHCRTLFHREGDADQFFDYMAHRVQRPEEKPRFALLLVGDQGVGKDSSVDFCSPALGPWNVKNIAPSAFEGAFNEFATGTLVRINEAANAGEMTRWAFNERTKVLIAGNPDECEINPKYGRKYTVKMYCGVIITTNHLFGSVHIPPDDRRFDVIQCASLDEMGLADEAVRRDYFTSLWSWFFTKDGAKHVAAFLHERDLSGFSAAMGQRKTAAHADVMHNGMAGDEWLDDILDAMRYPDYVRGNWITDRAGEKEGEVRVKMGHALRRAGYDFYRNTATKDGRWKVNGEKFTLFIKKGVPPDKNILEHLKVPEAHLTK